MGFVIADLLSNGIQVALPLSEHLPFDCIAVDDSGRLKRLSVKYRTAVDGAISLKRLSSWADKHGTHTRKHARGDYDAFAVYCPNTGNCYYVLESEIEGTNFQLRLAKPKNNQTSGIHLASDYLNPSRIFLAP